MGLPDAGGESSQSPPKFFLPKKQKILIKNILKVFFLFTSGYIYIYEY